MERKGVKQTGMCKQIKDKRTTICYSELGNNR